MRSGPSFALLALSLAACGSASIESDAPAVVADGAADFADAVTPVEPAAPSALPLVTLDSEGLRLVDAQTGASRPLAFGASMDMTVDVLTRAFESEPAERSRNAECGAGPIDFVAWPNGFLALFQEGRFLGWDVRSPGLTTASGVGIGATRAELEASHDARVSESTLGTEFSVGALGGILASPAPSAPITSLWAGLTCHFR